MDPEKLQEILAAVQAAQQRGATMEDINTKLQEETGMTLPGIITAARGGTPASGPAKAVRGGPEGVSPSRREEALARTGQDSPLRNFASALAQGITLGASDEIAGGAAALGALVPGGRSPGDAFSEVRGAEAQRIEDLRELNPGTTAVTEVGGGLLTGAATIPLKAGRSLLKGAGSAAARRASGSAAASAGAGAQLAARGAERASRVAQATRGVLPGAKAVLKSDLGAAGNAARVGAIEGGILGAAGTEGDITERATSGAVGAAAGGAIGGGLATVLRLPAGVKDIFSRRRIRAETRNPRIASRSEGLLADASPTETLPSRVLDGVEEQKRLVSEGFKALEGQAVRVPPAAKAVLHNRSVRSLNLQRELDRLDRPNALNRVLSDDRPLEFEDIQAVRSALQDEVDALFRQGKNNQAFNLAAKKRQFDKAMAEMLPEEGPLRQAWRNLSLVPDALTAGENAVNMPTDRLRTVLRDFSDTPEAMAGFQTGLVRGMLDDFAKRFGQKAKRPSQDFINKLKLAVGEDAANQIVGVMVEEGAQEAKEFMQDFLIKAGGFIAGNTSLLGGAFLAGAAGG